MGSRPTIPPPWINQRLLRQLYRFGVSTGLSLTLSFALPVSLHEYFGVATKLAVGVGFITAYVMNFVLVRRFVFQSERGWRSDIPRYVLTNGAFRITEYGAFLIVSGLSHVNYAICLFVILAVSSVLKFLSYRFLFDPRRRVSVEKT